LLKKLHDSKFPKKESDKENSEDLTVNKATGQARKKNFLEKRMFGDYGQNKDPVDEWDDDFENSNPAQSKKEVAKKEPEKNEPPKKDKKKPAFDDDYDDDFGDESEGAVHDSKQADFDELAAGKKKNVYDAFQESSKNDIPSLPRSRKESSE